MKKLVELLIELKREKIRTTVSKKISEFKKIRKSTTEDIFQELCFCILAANYSAKRALEIQNALGREMLYLNRDQLSLKLKTLGYRFPNTRARYISEAQKMAEEISAVVKNTTLTNDKREYLIENVLGLGYKEASHFLRNTGHLDVAIIDFHIIDALLKYNVIKEKKTLTPKRYIEIERILTTIAENAELSLGEMDLYLWYAETGEIIK